MASTMSRARQSTATPGPASRRSTGNTGIALPEYEPPSYTLNPAAQRTLANLTRNHNVGKLTTQLDAAQQALNAAAVDINDRLTERSGSLIKIRRRAEQRREEENGEEDQEDNEHIKEMEQKISQMKEKVDSMAQRMEVEMRKLIDGKQGVRHLEQSVNEAAEEARNKASTQASTQNTGSQRARRSRGDGEDGEGEGDGEGGNDESDEIPDFQPTDPAAGTQPEQAPLNVFKSKLDDAKTRYQSYSMGDRYGKDNDYINFRRAVHDAQYPDDDVPMPPPNEWFNEDGTVAAPGHTARRREGDEDESDDDIAIEKASISTKCPLTLQEFKDPITSSKCSHSFEKTAILELFGRSPHVRCPVGGCSEQLTKRDLRTDPVLVRKIQRIQRAKQMQQEQDDEDEEDNARRGNTQGRSHVIDDDDAANIDDEDDDDEEEPVQAKTEPRATNEPPPPSQAIDLGDSDED